jgi:beta-glucosidase
MKLICQPLDALGFNCYTGSYVRAADNPKGYEVMPMFEGYPKSNMPWLNILPDAIYWGIRLVSESAGKKSLPIFISENGCADGASPTADELVRDTDRIMYYRAYLRQVQRAVAEGYPVIGYFPWSLLDNFEWTCGYSKRFGMVRVNFQTQKRTPKLSYRWYQEVIRQNRVT